MPVFFFDTVVDGAVITDGEGSELDGPEAARLAALEYLPELVSHRSSPKDQTTYSVDVRDEVRRAVYRATITISGEWLADFGPAA